MKEVRYLFIWILIIVIVCSGVYLANNILESIPTVKVTEVYLISSPGFLMKFDDTLPPFARERLTTDFVFQPSPKTYLLYEDSISGVYILESNKPIETFLNTMLNSNKSDKIRSKTWYKGFPVFSIDDNIFISKWKNFIIASSSASSLQKSIDNVYLKSITRNTLTLNLVNSSDINSGFASSEGVFYFSKLLNVPFIEITPPFLFKIKSDGILVNFDSTFSTSNKLEVHYVDGTILDFASLKIDQFRFFSDLFLQLDEEVKTHLLDTVYASKSFEVHLFHDSSFGLILTQEDPSSLITFIQETYPLNMKMDGDIVDFWRGDYHIYLTRHNESLYIFESLGNLQKSLNSTKFEPGENCYLYSRMSGDIPSGLPGLSNIVVPFEPLKITGRVENQKAIIEMEKTNE